MAKKKSTASKFDDGDGMKEESDSSTSASTHRQANARTTKNILLIWLDRNIDENSKHSKNIMTQFRRVINSVNTFTDGDECIKFIESLDNDKTFIVISGSLGQHIVPRIHDMYQVESIFIFCSNKTHHEQWAKDWSKIQGVFTDSAPICEALQQATQQSDQNDASTSFVPTNDDVSTKKLDQLDPSFMYTQILKEILLRINFKEKHIKEFINYCRVVYADNQHELENIDRLEKEYHEKKPIWWYTWDSFLYTMLDRALRLMQIDIIIKMGFFLRDLHCQIEQLHSKQFQGSHSRKIFTVYRGESMPKAAFEKIAQSKGGLISFNKFLSTNRNRDASLAFTQRALSKPDFVGILFVMKIDPSISTVPFASTRDVSYYHGEDDVLFSMHTVFRIVNIKPMGKNHGLFEVDLILTNDTDQDLRMLTDRVREEIGEHSNGWYQLSLLLRKMGEIEKAQQIYEVILEQTTDEHEKGNLYHQIGSTKADQGEYQEALSYYEKSLEIQKKILPPNHHDLASSYNSIGSVYANMGEYSKALSYYEKTLEIRQKILPKNHPDLATSYNNIGKVKGNMGEYPKALSYYEKSLEIQQQSLPPNHPDLAASYNNIGKVYGNMSEYPKALSYYEKSLEIQKQSLPSNHPDLATSYNNIGEVYGNMGEYPKALSYYEKSLQIRQQSLPPNHPDLATLYNSIGLVYANMGEYSKALSVHERAFNIGQHSLPANDPLLKTYKKNIDLVKKKL